MGDTPSSEEKPSDTDANSHLHVDNQISNEILLKQIEENRFGLQVVVETLVVIGQRLIPIRGELADGPFEGPLELNGPSNEGGFRELLKLRMTLGNAELNDHLKSSTSFISETSQKKIIKCCGDEVLSVIASRILEAKFYSVMCVEISKTYGSHTALLLRYVHKHGVREDFVRFPHIYSDYIFYDGKDLPKTESVGSRLGRSVLETLKELSLDLKYCVGFTTDAGCSVLASEAIEAVKIIQEEATNAVYCPTFDHKLNLSIPSSSSIQSVCYAVIHMKNAISSFNLACKYQRYSGPVKTLMGRELCELCENWTESHDGILRFRILLPKIVETLEYIQKEIWNDNISSLTLGLVDHFIESEFLIILCCLADLLTSTHQLSYFFQNTPAYLKSTHGMLQETIAKLEEKRKNCVGHFSSIYEEACKLAEEIGVDIELPPIGKLYHQCKQHLSSDPVIHYRESIFIPLVGNMIEDLKSRFSEQTLGAYYLSVLFPDSVILADDNLLKDTAVKLVEKYSIFFDKSIDTLKETIIPELQSWKLKWDRDGYDSSYTAIELLECCDSAVYPTIRILLQILVRLSLSTTTKAKTRSSLQRLDTWLTSTTWQDTQYGLSLLYAHNDILDLDADHIVDRFTKMCEE